MQWYIDVIKKYVEFSGRARRKEFWMFQLFNLIIGLVFELASLFADVFVYLYLLYGLFLILPSLAVTIRRIHDIGRSGWWFLIVLVPIVGPVVLLVFMLIDSEEETNEYGPNPKLNHNENIDRLE